MSTFAAWLAEQCHRADPVGDLARDVAADPDAPTGTPVDVLEHIDARGSAPSAREAVRAAAREWRATR